MAVVKYYGSGYSNLENKKNMSTIKARKIFENIILVIGIASLTIFLGMCMYLFNDNIINTSNLYNNSKFVILYLAASMGILIAGGICIFTRKKPFVCSASIGFYGLAAYCIFKLWAVLPIVYSIIMLVSFIAFAVIIWGYYIYHVMS